MKNNPSKSNKKIKSIICGATIVGVIGVSGIFAYLTDTDTATNKFTVGEVKIELYEPKWDGVTTDQTHDGHGEFGDEIDSNGNNIPDKAENLSANAEIEKDPQIKNTGENPAYVFLKVTIPKKSIITAGDDGTKNNDGQSKTTELFTYTVNSPDWNLVTGSEKDTEDSVTRVYYYKEALRKGEITSALFEKVKFANIIENQIVGDEVTLDIKIDAFAIQSDNLPNETSIEQAYTIYTNQNPDVKE